MANENCLEGIKCPKCDQEDRFGIACDILMLVTDQGTEEQLSDTEWDEDSYIECRECLHHGRVSDFRFEEGED